MNKFKPTTDSVAEEQTAEREGEPPEPGSPSAALQVLIANQQSSLPIDETQLEAAVLAIFRDSSYNCGTVSIAVVDDPTIHEINRQYLQHDYPTDVLSFVLEDREPYLEGELVVSTDTAATNAQDYDWPALNELLLYVVHGALHLVGYLDKQPDDIAEMRAAEAKYLKELGIAPPDTTKRQFGQVAEGEVPPQ